MSRTTQWLPPIASAAAQAPAGENPCDYYADRLAWLIFPGVASWSKPVFLIFGGIALINAPVTIFALWMRSRREGTLPFIKRSPHPGGGKFLVPNATNIFLAFHLFSSLALSIFALLHVLQYSVTGTAERVWMDMCWQVFVWLAPYLGLMMACLGCLYGILAVPALQTMHIYSRTASVQSRVPLLRVPRWLLNGVIVATPWLLIGSVTGPGVLLVRDIKQTETLTISLITTLRSWASLYDAGTFPDIGAQALFLQKLQEVTNLAGGARARWRPAFIVWAVWVGLAAVLAIASLVLVFRVTRTRILLAEVGTDSTLLDRDRVHCISPSPFLDGKGFDRARKKSVDSQATQEQLKQTRWDHYNVSLQFAASATVLLLSEVSMLFNCILGYKVHERINLLAVSILLPMASYITCSSVALALITTRIVQGKGDQSVFTKSPRRAEERRPSWQQHLTLSEAMAESPQSMKDANNSSQPRLVFRMPFEAFSESSVANADDSEDPIISMDIGPYDKTYVPEVDESRS